MITRGQTKTKSYLASDSSTVSARHSYRTQYTYEEHTLSTDLPFWGRYTSEVVHLWSVPSI